MVGEGESSDDKKWRKDGIVVEIGEERCLQDTAHNVGVADLGVI